MSRNLTGKAEVVIILLLACVPLVLHLPYRVNIFLSWEGAYRMSHGQLPFRDFGTPLGGMYWVIPAIFFKLFGPQLYTLVISQVLINIIAGLSFRCILLSLSVNRSIRLAAVVLFCVSYSFFNFWPWYNHSVIVYELAALALVLQYICRDEGSKKSAYQWLWLAAGALLTVCSFLTKQDGGGMSFGVVCLILAVHGWLSGKWRPLLLFAGSFAVLLLLIILPFLHDGFAYWFNHGQPPHSSRVSPMEIAGEFFGSSQWIKFYIFLIAVLVFARYRHIAALKADPRGVLLVALTLGMLAEAAVLQVTSYTPPDNNIFFHSFAFVCLFSLLASIAPLGLERPAAAVVLTAGVLLWWSGVWWKYTQRLTGGFVTYGAAVSKTGENVVNRSNYEINMDTVKEIPTEQWIECGLPSFRKITMPAPTVDGIHRLMQMDLVRNGQGKLRVLNMSELTPLAADMPYALERNPQLPLWYHLGVGMFNRQADTLEARIGQGHYDLVLFEYIPTLNNFYPFRVRDSLRLHYRQVDSFMAPRRGVETRGMIEVYVRPAGADTVSLGPVR